jgi:TRAP-type C4-dicarboxylate transport system permease small subunit
MKKWVIAFLEYFLIFMLVLMVLITTVQVFTRYLLNFTIIWSEELARYLFIWITFLGSFIALRHGTHISPGITVFERYPLIAKWVALGKDILSIVILCLLVVSGWQMVLLGRHSESPTLQIAMAPLYAALPLGAFLMLTIKVHDLAVRFFLVTKKGS